VKDLHAMTQSRSHLGELAVMASQTEAAERQILAHAEQMHGDVLPRSTTCGRVPRRARPRGATTRPWWLSAVAWST